MTRISRDEAIAVFLTERKMQNAFWSRVRLLPGCWEWRGARAQKGYGAYAVRKTLVLAHRLSYAYWHQVGPGPLLVCHSCDNPSCTNPEHLFLGTVEDNNADRHIKGRSRGGSPTWHGEGAPGAILTDVSVSDIRHRAARGERQVDLAAEFGVKPNTLSQLISRRTWKHIA